MNGSTPSLSTLLMKVRIGSERMRATSKSFRVCGSIPLAPSRSITTESTASRVLKVSSLKSLCPGVSRMFRVWSSYSKARALLVTLIPLWRSISIQSLVA